MNLDQLGQAVTRNKPAVLGAAAAGVVGLALLQRRRAGGDVSAGGGSVVSGPARVPASASYSAGGQVASAGGFAGGGFGSYDSSASDVAAWIGPQLEAIAQQTRPTPTPVPAPIAAGMFAPNWTGKYVRDASNGKIMEVQSDGSLFGLSTIEQWYEANNRNPESDGSGYTQLGPGDSIPIYYDTASNLAKTARDGKTGALLPAK